MQVSESFFFWWAGNVHVLSKNRFLLSRNLSLQSKDERCMRVQRIPISDARHKADGWGVGDAVRVFSVRGLRADR